MFVAPAPDPFEIIASLGREELAKAANIVPPDEYVHWDKLKHLSPPDGVSHEAWWALIKLSRQLNRLPLKSADGHPLKYGAPDDVQRLLHFVDQRCSGTIAMPEVVTTDEQARRHYLLNSLMEEAIRSSQLEGATTSRRVAKEMIKSGRAPKDRSERMILNNYRALEFMRDQMGDELTPKLVLELHRILTEGTLENPDAAGRLQRPDEERVGVYDRIDGSLVYEPPPAIQLPARLDALCEFANGGQAKGFIHPVIRAILIHFWVGYDHPFEDGNGRTARALFYWSMRTQGYWLTEYLSISRILQLAPAQYTRAYLLTETDNGDTTYFILYQLQVIRRAVDELHAYLRREVEEIREIRSLVRGSSEFNQRQLALLNDALKDMDREYTFRSHAAGHGVTHETARHDLLTLQRRGLLRRERRGRTYVFRAVEDVKDRLRG